MTTVEGIMAALACIGCERPAAYACFCCFPLPLLCESHRVQHSAHVHLPPDAFRCVRNEQTQLELGSKIGKLHTQLSVLKLYSGPKHQSGLDIRDFLLQFYRDVQELTSKAKELRVASGLESLQTESGRIGPLGSYIWSGVAADDELGTWVCIGRGLSLQAHFQYEESCRVLEDRWKCAQLSEGVETLTLGLVLSEVMGLHIGRFTEALAVIDKALDLTNPLSEVALQLRNLMAAIHIHTLNTQESLHLCMEAAHTFGEVDRSEVAYGTTLYFYLISYLKQGDNHPLMEKVVAKWIAHNKDSSNELVQHVRLCATAILETKETNYIDAEIHIKEASHMLHSSNSNYSALCSYLKNYIERKVLALTEDADYRDEEPCLCTHFPASLLRAEILMKNAEHFRLMKDELREIELRQSAHLLFQGNKSCSLFLENVGLLEKVLKATNQKDAAFELIYSTYRTLIFTDIDNHYSKQSCGRFEFLLEYYPSEKKEKVYKEIFQELELADPTHRYFAEIMERLIIEIYCSGRREFAMELCKEKHQLLLSRYSNGTSFYLSTELLCKYYFAEARKKECIETYLVGLQEARKYCNYQGYLILASGFFEKYPEYPKEKQIEIVLEAHQFFISNKSSECFKSLESLKMYYADQPEILLERMQETNLILQLNPTSKKYDKSLRMLSIFWQERNQLEKAVELRLEAHKILLRHLSSSNFLSNVQALVECCRDMSQPDAALQLRLEAHQLLRTQPTTANFQINAQALVNLYASWGRFELAEQLLLEVYHFLDVSQYPWVADDLVRVYCEMGRTEEAIQIKLAHLKSQESLTAYYAHDITRTAELYLQKGETESAVQLCLQFLLTFQERHLYLQSKVLLSFLDGVLTKAGQCTRAIGFQEKALRILERDGVTKPYKQPLKELLNLFDATGQKRKAVCASLQAICYTLQKSPNSSINIRFLKIAGRRYMDLGEICKSEALFCRQPRIRTMKLSSYFARYMAEPLANIRSLYKQDLI